MRRGYYSFHVRAARSAMRNHRNKTTAEERVAFDRGLQAGIKGESEQTNPHPHTDCTLWQAWLTGHSVGVLNRRSSLSTFNDIGQERVNPKPNAHEP